MIDEEKFYSVKELSGLSGWSVDTIRRQIYRGYLEAVQLPAKGGKRPRIYRSCRVLGLWWMQFLKKIRVK